MTDTKLPPPRTTPHDRACRVYENSFDSLSANTTIAAIAAEIKAARSEGAREAFAKAADEASDWGIETLFVQRLRSLARGKL